MSGLTNVLSQVDGFSIHDLLTISPFFTQSVDYE